VAVAMDVHSRGPLAGYQVALTEDPDEATEIISHTYCGHKVRVLDSSSALRFRFCEAQLDRTTVGAMSFGADFHYDLGETESYYLVQIADAGAIRYINGGELCEVTPSQAMVTSPTRPLRISYGAASRGLIFKISKTALERHLSALVGAPIGQPLIFDALVPAAAPFTGRYTRMLAYILSELEADRGLRDAPLVVARLEDMVMTALLTEQRHTYTHFFELPAPSAALRPVKRVEDYVHADPGRRHSIEDFVGLTGVSGRSLYRAFQTQRGYSPMAFVRNARLRLAHDRLAAPGAGDTVTRIAQDCGFDHLGRFGKDYRARYGQTPSQTLKAAQRALFD
jgi:AraC-like DNA-binding protein